MWRLCVLLLVFCLLISACSLQSAPQKKPEPTPAPAQQGIDQSVKEINKIRQSAEAFNGKTGIYAKNLNTGKILAINEHVVFPTASTHKLVVALAAYKYLYPKSTPEKKKQYNLHIRNMLQTSDNPSFYNLVRELELRQPEALNQVLKDLRLKNTWIHSEEAFRKFGYHSVTTPIEMASVLETIYLEQYLGKETSAILKEELAKIIFKDEIPRFMQKNKVMHKAGSLPGMLCEVAILDDGKDQILISIFTTSAQADKQSSLFIAETTVQLYEALREREP